MSKNFLKQDSLPLFLEAVATFGELHGPILTDDAVPAFRPIDRASELYLDYRRTLLPPKKYLLPPKDPILSYTPETGYQQSALSPTGIILFGVHPCDLAGIAYLDAVFMGDFPDPLYSMRRQALTLIGLSCEPDDLCFCGDTGCDVPKNFDLFMQSSGEGFFLLSGSTLGRKMLGMIPMLLEEREIPAPTHREHRIFADIRYAATQKEAFAESPLWDDFAARCLSCGACSLCCPTCYCFDVQENGSLDGKTAKRLREWDNCLFRTHGEVAGGYNFRKTRQERFRYRYQHKYLGFGPTRGMLACVGCGRCREVCPVRIDLLELFSESSHDRRP